MNQPSRPKPAPHIREHRFEIDGYRPAPNPDIWSEGGRQLHLHVFCFPRIGDVDGDGRLELIYSKGCSGQAVYQTDGKLRWKFHQPGLKTFEHAREDSLVPVFDFARDGRAAMGAFRLIGGKTHLCMLDAASGSLIRSTPLVPNEMTVDTRMSLVPAQLDGPDRPFSLVLTRDYWRIEVYDHRLRPRWNAAVKEMGHTAHVADIDGDGRDEIFTGTHLFRADGSLVWAKPELLEGTGETHPDSMVAADVDGDGRMELVVATGAQLLDADGKVRWSRRDQVHHAQAVRTLRTARGPLFCFVDQPMHDRKDRAIEWRGRTLRDVTAVCSVFDGEGKAVGQFDSVHTPQVGDWDGDGDDEIFALARDRVHVDVHRADGSLVDRIPVTERAYVSDMAVAPLLPRARGAQLIMHDWSEDETHTDCVIFENLRAGPNCAPAEALQLARQTCY